VVVALRLLAHVLEEPALGPPNEASSESAFGAQDKTGIAGMGDRPSKLGT
jgi:hypothetical protein